MRTALLATFVIVLVHLQLAHTYPQAVTSNAILSTDVKTAITEKYLTENNNVTIMPGNLRNINVSQSNAMNITENGTELQFANCYQMPENDCPYQDVTLWYFNNHIADSEGYMVTPMNMSSLPILKGAPWVIIFHGFTCSKDGTPNKELRPAYFQRGFYNILSADVHRPLDGGLLKALCYPSAARNIYHISRCYAELLSTMIQSGVLPPPPQLHFVGHSLGAHIAGSTASELRNKGMGTVLRVTGLDPAGPLLWRSITASYKILNPTDATVVDAHHTSGGHLYSEGQRSPMGTVDIYYNGGKRQPNCKRKIGCSHHKVVEYYAESIYPLPPLYNRFYSISPSIVLVGEDMTLNTSGIINVNTLRDRPYALGLNP